MSLLLGVLIFLAAEALAFGLLLCLLAPGIRRDAYQQGYLDGEDIGWRDAHRALGNVRVLRGGR